MSAPPSTSARPAAPPARPAASPSTPMPGAEFDAALVRVEQAIAVLGAALPGQDAEALQAAAAALQAALRAAMERFAQATRHGKLPAPLRHRLALARGQIAAQREALFRATNTLEQALDIFVPPPEPASGVYSAAGGVDRGPGRVIAAS